MTEELLYLGLLLRPGSERIHLQYQLCLARDLVCKKHPDISQQEVQESFEELALYLKSQSFILNHSNPFSHVAYHYKRENM